MSFKRALTSALLLLGTLNRLLAQTESDPETEILIESVMENREAETDFSELQETLDHYRRDPLDLNKATEHDLQNFFFLSPLQIAALLRYRKENGALRAPEELQVIENFDATTIRRLLPYVKVKEAALFTNLSLKSLKTRSSQDLILTCGQILQKQAGYNSNDSAGLRYPGGPQHLMLRYRYRYGKNVSAAITLDNDPGERLFRNWKSGGFDFGSANIFYKGEGKVRAFVAGDYTIQAGQGLAMWTGLSFTSGTALTSVVRQASTIKPYSSANESLFLRGAAAELSFRRINVLPFFSYRRLDAGLISAADSAGEGGINSISQSGLHRTPKEIENKGNIRQLIAGSRLQYSRGAFRLGGLVYCSKFDEDFLPHASLYQNFRFTGSSLTNISLYYNYNWQNFYFFGEAAKSINAGFAYMTGLLSALSPKVSLVLLLRNYQKDYQSFYGQGMRAGSNGTAERGFYSGLSLSLTKSMDLNLSADLFSFPWLKYRADAPSRGAGFYSRFSFSPNKSLKLMVSYKYRVTGENVTDGQTENGLEDVKRQSLRFDIQSKSGSFLFRNRVELSLYDKADNKEHGSLIYQDVICKPVRSRLSGNVRIAFFDTEGYNPRIYAYENDILYSYSSPAYYDRGIRFYINSKYKLNRNTEVAARYAISSYDNKEEIGSGPDAITGHNKSELKIQLRVQF